MMRLSMNALHLIVGIVAIVAIVVLAVTHNLSGSEAATIITGFAGILLGTSAMGLSPAGTEIVARPPGENGPQPCTPPRSSSPSCPREV